MVFFLGDVILTFEFTEGFKEADTNKITQNYTVTFLSSAEFSKYYKAMGISDYDYKEYTNKSINFRTGIDICKNHISGTIRVTQPDINQSNDFTFAFYLTRLQIIMIEISDRNHYIRQIFTQTIQNFTDSEYQPERFLSMFLDRMVINDNAGLENIEKEINQIENNIISGSICKNFNEELLKYKRKLLNLRNFYEQLIDIVEIFSSNENRLFRSKNNQYFNSFIKKTERLCSDVNLIRESLVQLRETYQSHLDLRLNNTMKIFTVLTAFFSPLTLIAGWYGMNFEYMPELKWRYGYLFVILLSISSVVSCLIVFKRKKMM